MIVTYICNEVANVSKIKNFPDETIVPTIFKPTWKLKVMMEYQQKQ